MSLLKRRRTRSTITAAEKFRISWRKTPTWAGDQLEDASVMPGEYGQPEVNFRFDPDGRRKFADFTG